MDGISAAMARIDQIQNRFEQSVAPPDAQAFGAAFQQANQEPPAPQAPPAGGIPPNMLGGMNPMMGMMNGAQFGGVIGAALQINPLAQSNSISCGQTSVAMAVNSVTGKNLKDTDINEKYGFGLLNALNTESASAGVKWRDAGEVGANNWQVIDQKVNQEKTPVIVALNGPLFSPSGHGHIVTIIKTEGDKVTYADPASGTIKTTTKQAMNDAPPHPDGKFIFVADRNNAPMMPNNMVANMMPSAPQGMPGQGAGDIMSALGNE